MLRIWAISLGIIVVATPAWAAVATAAQPEWVAHLTQYLTNPTIAYLLILVAIYGLFFELANPGFILPGLTGVVALALALYGLQYLSINYVGLTLFLLGVAFLLFEIFLTTYGIIGFLGLIIFIVGSLMLFESPKPFGGLSLSLIICMSLITAAFFFVVLTVVFRSHKKNIVTGKEGLIGSHGIVIEMMNEQIAVRVLGEIWAATSTARLQIGEEIIVTQIKGLVLTVEPLNETRG